MAREDARLVPSSHTGAGLISALVAKATELRRSVRDWLLARATVNTLSALDDRTLKDIGLSRGEISEAVRQSKTTSPAARSPGAERG